MSFRLYFLLEQQAQMPSILQDFVILYSTALRRIYLAQPQHDKHAKDCYAKVQDEHGPE